MAWRQPETNNLQPTTKNSSPNSPPRNLREWVSCYKGLVKSLELPVSVSAAKVAGGFLSVSPPAAAPNL